MEKTKDVSMQNIYKLDGRVPLGRAIPFGLQHVLAMFVSNLTPITIIGAASGLDQSQLAILLQNAMFIAGIATLIQLYPVWRVGARLPIVMGVSFTFVTILTYVGSTYGYETMIGAVIVGGIFEGTLGLLAKYWKRIITPVVAASVVTAIGYSLFTVGARSFGGGYTEDFGSAQNLLLGTITLSGGVISLPHFLPFKPEFNLGAIISVSIIFLVSAAETIGDTTAMVAGGLNREITTKEISGSLACDGYASCISGLFGCPPVTSFSQNVGLINMTKVVNRFTIMTGAGCMILAGLLPPVGNFFASLPDAVLGGCTIMMFGTIMVSGIQMISKAGFSQRNVTIVALSLAVGIGFTSASEMDIWRIFPQVVQDVFSANCVAVVFVVSIVLSLVLPKDMDIKKIEGK